MSSAHHNIELGQISKLISGAGSNIYTAEKAPNLQKVYILKGKDVDQEGNIATEGMEQVSFVSTANSDRYLLREGDVVLMSRGSAIRAGYVSHEVEWKKAIASPNFIIIRPNKDKILGEVVVAYLNSVLGQRKLSMMIIGAAIPHIAASNLKRLEIPIPEKSTQQKISDYFYASRDAYSATIALAKQQKETANAAILNMMVGVA